MNLFASYGLSILEYISSGKYYALTEESTTVRSKAWEFIHEFGVCLQSFSMLLFSMERYAANKYPAFHESPTFLCCITGSIVISLLLSFCFSLAVHVYEHLILATLLMEFSDYLGLIILISAWRSSKRNYRLSAGKASLKRRYQMSEVYAWTNTLLPAVVGASVFKVLSMVPIWTWLLLDLSNWEYGIANFLYNNILNVYVCIFPWVLIARSQSLKKQILSKKRVKPDVESMRSASSESVELEQVPVEHCIQVVHSCSKISNPGLQCRNMVASLALRTRYHSHPMTTDFLRIRVVSCVFLHDVRSSLLIRSECFVFHDTFKHMEHSQLIFIFQILKSFAKRENHIVESFNATKNESRNVIIRDHLTWNIESINDISGCLTISTVILDEWTPE
ncbi:hypothetical protein GCK72_018901 [Caenorhabditis remanei]|uniref:Uncharacterized protein n=1 Tax=Caenorhabditis remanei TaxID=31234 RepID=A0A6A5GAZ6_CAERE|nr:hypothetical protein GCK72_018901 [Caenorhabditis remanei]KAF1752347.1 hypothetical protein GCK72_018901 [Caenorhabditis remanei]